MKNLRIFLGLWPLLIVCAALANTRQDPHVPLSHCYHWLDEASAHYLSYKYSYAAQHEGELTFYTTGGNGAVAGPGLYCAKTPADSYGYGDRVIRIDFVDDVVVYDSLTGRQYCGLNGDFYSSTEECNSKAWDVKFYYGGGRGQMAWYVIRNPQAILKWSAVSPQLIADLIANKPVEQAFSIHADNTIALIQADPMAKKVTAFDNHNARLSILKILADAKKLAQVPPLTVIAMVRNFKGPELSDSAKNKIYDQQFARAFTDTKLAHSDFRAVIKDDDAVEASYQSQLRRINLDQLDKFNPIVILQGWDEYGKSAELTGTVVHKLWRAALLSDSDLESLTETPLKKGGAFADGFEGALPTIGELKTRLVGHNLSAFMGLLNTHVNSGISPNTVDILKFVMGQFLENHGSSFVKAYDKINNAKLRKETILAQALSDALAGSLKKLDPLTLGLALDRAKDNLSSSVVTNAQTKILGMPLVMDTIPSYQMLEDFQYGKLAVPEFYGEVALLKKLLERAIAERSVSKTPSNAYRMSIAGLFYLYNERVRQGKDDAKKTVISQAAGNSLLALAAEMNSPELAPYRYAVVQNASLFAGNGRYADHPLDSAFATYAKGRDNNFNGLFESVIETSDDGSVLQFLIGAADHEASAVNLLRLMIDRLTSAAFSSEMATATYVTSQKEKKAWDNVIYKGRYAETSRVPSDLCHVATIALRFKAPLVKVVGNSKANQLKRWAENMTAGACK